MKCYAGIFCLGLLAGGAEAVASMDDTVGEAGGSEVRSIVVQEGDGLPDTLPADLVWLTNDEDPVYASPEAKRGGTLRLSITSFPLTLRRVGPDSNGSFAGFLRPNHFGAVALQPADAPCDPRAGD